MCFVFRGVTYIYNAYRIITDFPPPTPLSRYKSFDLFVPLSMHLYLQVLLPCMWYIWCPFLIPFMSCELSVGDLFFYPILDLLLLYFSRFPIDESPPFVTLSVLISLPPFEVSLQNFFFENFISSS